MKKTILLFNAMLLGGLVATPISADQVKADVAETSSVVKDDNTHQGFTIPDGFNASGDATGHNVGQGVVEVGHPATVTVQPMGHKNGESGESHEIEGTIEVTGIEHCTVQQNGNTLIITPEPGYEDEFVVHITVHGNSQEGTFTGDIRITQWKPITTPDVGLATAIQPGTHGIMPTRPVIDNPEPDTNNPAPDTDKPKPDTSSPDTKLPGRETTKPDTVVPKPKKKTTVDKLVQNNKTEDNKNGRNQVSTNKKQSSKQDTKNQSNPRKSSTHRTLPNTGSDTQTIVSLVGTLMLFIALLIFFIV